MIVITVVSIPAYYVLARIWFGYAYLQKSLYMEMLKKLASVKVSVVD